MPQKIDHLGIIAGLIKQCGIVEMLDELLGNPGQQDITFGEAGACMIINCLGFTSQPLLLMPNFFQHRAISQLLGREIDPKKINRFKLGRFLDRLDEVGCEFVFMTIAKKIAEINQVDTRFVHLDTTSFSVTGRSYSPEEIEIQIAHGHSKDHRRDLMQMLQELLVAGDGGVPLISKSHSGNASDSTIFQERSKMLRESLQKAEFPQFLVADCKLYNAKSAHFLREIPFITRIPSSLKAAKVLIEQATLNEAAWIQESESKRFQKFSVKDLDMEQRWIVTQSKAGKERAEESVDRMVKKESDQIAKQLGSLQKKRFQCPSDGRFFVEEMSKKWDFHKHTSIEVIEYKTYLKAGRPSLIPQEDQMKSSYQLLVKYGRDDKAIEDTKRIKSCYIIGSNVEENELSDQELIEAYANQQKVERGFRMLKDPLFFTSSFFLKKTSRIRALLCVMSITLLIYNIGERGLRLALQEQQKTLPNQLGARTKTPTLRWVFQMMEGIYVRRKVNKSTGVKRYVIEGLTRLKLKIIKLFGSGMVAMYTDMVLS